MCQLISIATTIGATLNAIIICFCTIKRVKHSAILVLHKVHSTFVQLYEPFGNCSDFWTFSKASDGFSDNGGDNKVFSEWMGLIFDRVFVKNYMCMNEIRFSSVPLQLSNINLGFAIFIPDTYKQTQIIRTALWNYKKVWARKKLEKFASQLKTLYK